MYSPATRAIMEPALPVGGTACEVGRAETMIRPMKKEDIPEVLRGWNEALPLDAAGAEKFERIVLGDPNYDAGGTLVAVGRGGIVGFATCVAPQLSPEDQESWRAAEKDFAFLKGVFYGDEPAGEALLERVTEFARSRRKRIIRIVQYGGGKWFFPGIDLRYEGLLGFFQRNGFEQTRQIQDVTLDLTSYRPGRGEYQRRQWEKLKAAGIEIPFPQRDLHVRSVEPDVGAAFSGGARAPEPPLATPDPPKEPGSPG